MAVHPRPSHVRVCVSVVVLSNQRVLLLRRGPSAPFDVGAWTVPSGGIEPSDSSLLAAAARELWEETGLTLVAVSDCEVVDGLSAGRPFVTVVHVGEAAGQARNAEPSVHDEIGWFTVDELPSRTWDRDLLVRILRGGK